MWPCLWCSRASEIWSMSARVGWTWGVVHITPFLTASKVQFWKPVEVKQRNIPDPVCVCVKAISLEIFLMGPKLSCSMSRGREKLKPMDEIKVLSLMENVVPWSLGLFLVCLFVSNPESYLCPDWSSKNKDEKDDYTASRSGTSLRSALIVHWCKFKGRDESERKR